jgi:CHAT domain-containing protein
LIEEGRVEEAFRVAERARAFEPLDLVRNLPNAPAAFRELAAQPDNLDVVRLRAFLPPGTFLIEYRVFDDKTYAWIAGRDVFTGQWLPARRSDVKRWTTALQEAASSRDTAAFENGLFAPYDGLLKAPLDLVNRFRGGAAMNMVIVPDRELRGLPFAALRNPDTKRCAIEDNVLSMSGSALLYVFAILRDHDLASRDASALLVGDPAFDPQSTLARGFQRLSFARKEIDAIRSFYPNPSVLMDDAATPRRFLSLASDNAIIHIAAHGVVNGEAPSQSFLLFNGLLNAQMLMKDLHADKTRLVVLGACSSAGGLPVGTEGIAPLVRPLVGAGVPGVIGTLWDIDDATAEGLLVSFHRHYRQGKDAAAALRDAQLEFLRSNKPGQSPARFWAPFQAIGYASSPFASIGDITKEKPP